MASDVTLTACKDAGVKTAIGSIWGNDGTECNYMFSLHGVMILIFVEMSYFHNDYENKIDESYHTR